MFVCLQVPSLSIPPKWLKTFGHIFSHPASHQDLAQKTLTVTRAMPVLLTEVIITALSNEAYHVASSRGSSLWTWLSNESLILRQGDIYTFSPELLPTNSHAAEFRGRYHYRLEMAEPVLQGYARTGHTRFYVTFTDKPSKDLFSEDEIDFESEEYSGSNPDGIEIDESFLASSVLHTNQTPPPSHRQPIPLLINGREYPIGDLGEPSAAHTGFQFQVEPLSEPTSASKDDYTLYLCTSDLNRLGVLDGDWVRFYNI